MDTKARPEERECMMSTTSPQLYWKVCLINAAVFVFAATLLLFSPATVSSQVTRGEVVVVAMGTLVIVLLNAWLLRNSLAPLDRLIQLMDKTEGDRPGERLPEGGSGVADRVARSINALQDRLEAERAIRNVRALAAQEAERHRIGHELHDEVGQRLTVVLLGLSRALEEVTGPVGEELRLVQDNARTSLEEVRRLSRGLRPGILEDLGLGPALAAMADEIRSHTGLSIHEHLCPDPPQLTRDAELVVFRVAQEALTNAARHADARHVELSLATSSEALTLTVCDDGRGIGPRASGEGIRGMHARARLVGGILHIGPAVQSAGGTEVRMQVPLPPPGVVTS